jgi:hypothetical protein
VRVNIWTSLVALVDAVAWLLLTRPRSSNGANASPPAR